MASTPSFSPFRREPNSVSGNYAEGRQLTANSSYGTVINGFNNHLKRILDPRGPFGNWILLALCVTSSSSDPLFFYIFVLDTRKHCVAVDIKLAITASVLRSFFDISFIVCSMLYFKPGAVNVGRANASNYFLRPTFLNYFLSCLPVPQVFTLIFITKRGSEFFPAVELLKGFATVQYVPRFSRIYQLYTEAERTSGVFAQGKRVKASCCILIYLLAASVLGALWYLMAIERNTECWKKACADHTGCRHSSFYCHDVSGDYTFLNGLCATMIQDTRMSNFGIFHEALQSGILQEKDFIKKFIYCFRWGLLTISCLGQNLQTSTYVGENFLAIFTIIASLLLLLLVLGNLQICMQSGAASSEERRFRERDIEQWRLFDRLPRDLQLQLRNYRQFVWQQTRGVDAENLLNNVPRNIRSTMMSHLFLKVLKKVPMFERMEEKLLCDICDCLKPVLYPGEYYIVKEGEPIAEMLFITDGTVSITTTNGGSTCIFKEYLSNGDFWGVELPTYFLDPCLPRLPHSTSTVKTITNFEAFALKADDLKNVVHKFYGVDKAKIAEICKFCSPRWRAWKARVIQVAWRRYEQKKIERSLCTDVNSRLQVELAEEGGNSSMLCTVLYAVQFYANSLRAARRNRLNN